MAEIAEQGAADDKESEERDVGSCPFYDVGSKNLQIAHVLLHNLGARMLRGLKNSTTQGEHEAIILCMKIIEREVEWREGGSHGCLEKPAPETAEDER